MTEIDPLTQTVYEFIVAYIREKGFAPSLRDIGKGCHLAHTTIYVHLGVLEGKGWIAREYKVPRSIRLGEQAPDYIELK